MISRSRRNLCSFDEEDNTSTKANRSHAGGVLHAKEGLGWGGGAHRERCSEREVRSEGRDEEEEKEEGLQQGWYFQNVEFEHISPW